MAIILLLFLIILAINTWILFGILRYLETAPTIGPMGPPGPKGDKGDPGRLAWDPSWNSKVHG